MRKRKNNDLNTYANEAAAAGMTYGERQAKEYASQIKIGTIPSGYRKAGESSRKNGSNTCSIRKER